MRRFAEAAMAALITLSLWGAAAHADSNQRPESNESVSGQFKEGAHRIGEGAVHIGEGIKQGAIDAWQATKAGVSAAADKVRQATSKSGGSTPPSDSGAQR
jgi:hypothetical protein